MGQGGREVTISVVIPTFNRANVIAECVETVLGQTCDEVEIIVGHYEFDSGEA